VTGLRALDRNLVRDIRRLWAQSLAIALVMACGVATLVLSVGTYRSLDETRRAYYERYRFGDVFASAVRAPKSLADEISAIDGIAAVETRIVKQALLDIDGMREPATGMLISVPPNGEFAVNAIFLREGRMPEPGWSNEAVVNRNFAEAHHFGLGSEFKAVLAGTKVSLKIVGIALSPEYVYAIGPGDMMPDNRRFGVIWLSEKSLAALYDLDGAFNSVSLRLLHDANEGAVIERLDALLDRYGGAGAHGRKDQLSNAFLDGELSQLLGRKSSRLCSSSSPPSSSTWSCRD
jgi:putative ABC transport system permease protein